jgi:hypothetical protein
MKPFNPTQYDLENVEAILAGKESHFSAHLYRLISRADHEHRTRLRQVYPGHVAAFEKWERNEATHKKLTIEPDEYQVSIYLTAGGGAWYTGKPNASLRAALMLALHEWATAGHCAAGMLLRVHALTGNLGAESPKPLWDLPLEPVIRQIKAKNRA